MNLLPLNNICRSRGLSKLSNSQIKLGKLIGTLAIFIRLTCQKQKFQLRPNNKESEASKNNVDKRDRFKS